VVLKPLARLSNINAKYLHGFPSLLERLSRGIPDYDEFWEKKKAWVSQLHASTVPNLKRRRPFGIRKDPWGPWQFFRHVPGRNTIPGPHQLHRRWPWFHGELAANSQGRFHRHHSVLLDTKTRARVFAKPSKHHCFFRYYFAWRWKEKNPSGKPATFFKVALTPGAPTPSGRPKESKPTNSRFSWPTARFHSILPSDAANNSFRRKTIPANTFPIPPIQFPYPPAPHFPSHLSRPAIGAPGRFSDQRFVDHRPDVLSYVSRPVRSRPSTIHRTALRKNFSPQPPATDSGTSWSNSSTFYPENPRRPTPGIPKAGPKTRPIRAVLLKRLRTPHRHGSPPWPATLESFEQLRTPSRPDQPR